MGTQLGGCTSDVMWRGDAIRCMRGGDWAKKSKNRAAGTRFWPTRCGWAHFWVVDTSAWCCGCSCCVAAANGAAAVCWICSRHCLPALIRVPSHPPSFAFAIISIPLPSIPPASFVPLCTAGARCLYLHQIQI